MKQIVLFLGLWVAVNHANALQFFEATDFQIPDAPLMSSEIYKQDFEQLHAYEHSRSAADCTEGQDEDKLSLNEMFGPKRGLLTDREIASVQFAAVELMTKASKVVSDFKRYYKRPRPYETDHSLKPCIRVPIPGYAYPSGHATMGRLISIYLAKKFPDRAEALKEQGTRIGWLRAMIGVHHPSDIVTGQSLGDQMAEAWLKGIR